MIPKVPQSYLSMHAIQIRLEMVTKQVLECTIFGKITKTKKGIIQYQAQIPVMVQFSPLEVQFSGKIFKKGTLC